MLLAIIQLFDASHGRVIKKCHGHRSVATPCVIFCLLTQKVIVLNWDVNVREFHNNLSMSNSTLNWNVAINENKLSLVKRL